MATKDSSVANRLLHKIKELESVKQDIMSCLEKKTDNVIQGAQAVLATSANDRRQFRKACTKANQAIEACIVKLMEINVDLEKTSDDDTDDGSNIGDIDSQSTILSEQLSPFKPTTAGSALPLSSSQCSGGERSSVKDAHEPVKLNTSRVTPSPPVHFTGFAPMTRSTVPTAAMTSTPDSVKQGNDSEIHCQNAPQFESEEPEKQDSKFLRMEQWAEWHPPASSISKGQNPSYTEKNADTFSPDQQQSACASESSEATVVENGVTVAPDYANIAFVGGGRGASAFAKEPMKRPGPFVHLNSQDLDTIVNSLTNATLSETKEMSDGLNDKPLEWHEQNIYNYFTRNPSAIVDKSGGIGHDSEPISHSGFLQGECGSRHLPSAQKVGADRNSLTDCATGEKSKFLGTFSQASQGKFEASQDDNVPAQAQFNYPEPHVQTKIKHPSKAENGESGSGYNFEPFTRGVPVSASDQMQHTAKNVESAKEKNSFKAPDRTKIVHPVLEQRELRSHGSVAPGFQPIFPPNQCASSSSKRKASPGFDSGECRDVDEVVFRLPQLQFDEGSVIIGVVAHVNSPSSFYFRPSIKHSTNDIESLSNQLHNFYNSVHRDIYTAEPKIGMVCCALSYKDNTWYRAVITKVHKPENYPNNTQWLTLRYVDQGNTEDLPSYRLRFLDDSFLSKPCLVVHCSLHKAKFLPNQTEWNEDQIFLFKNLVFFKDLKAIIRGTLPTGEFDVELIVRDRVEGKISEYGILPCLELGSCYPDGDRNTPSPNLKPADEREKVSFVIEKKEKALCNNLKMNNMEAVKSKSNYRVNNMSDGSSENNGRKFQAVTLDKPPLCWEDLASQESESSDEKPENRSDDDLDANEFTPNKISSTTPTIRNLDLPRSEYISKAVILQVLMAHVVSPGEFYVHPVVEETVCIDTLEEELKQYSQAQAPLALVDKQAIPVGSFFCAKFPKNGAWYRAKVLEVKEIEDSIETGMPLDKTTDSKKKKKKTKTKSSSFTSKFKVLVFYVDYGDSAWIESNDLRHLKLEFYEKPALAVRCRLANVIPIRNEAGGHQGWSTEATKALETWAEGDKLMGIEVTNVEDCAKSGVHDVMLCNLETQNYFNTEIVKLGLAVKSTKDEIDQMELWDPMGSDFTSLRNSYAVDVDDAGVALTGYKARDESVICFFYQRGQPCKRGSTCPYKHIKPSMDGTTTDKQEVMYSTKSVELPSIGTTVGVEVTAAMSASHFYVNFPVSSKHLPTLAEGPYRSPNPNQLRNAYRGVLPQTYFFNALPYQGFPSSPMILNQPSPLLWQQPVYCPPSNLCAIQRRPATPVLKRVRRPIPIIAPEDAEVMK